MQRVNSFINRVYISNRFSVVSRLYELISVDTDQGTMVFRESANGKKKKKKKKENSYFHRLDQTFKRKNLGPLPMQLAELPTLVVASM